MRRRLVRAIRIGFTKTPRLYFLDDDILPCFPIDAYAGKAQKKKMLS